MHCLTVLLIAVLGVVGLAEAAKRGEQDFGTFIHLTDMHFSDVYVEGGDPDQDCRATATFHPETTKWGNAACDAPATLIRSMLAGFDANCGSADFALWTGDNEAHLPYDEFDEARVVRVLQQTTDMVAEWAGRRGLRVIPTLGNHEAMPSSQIAPNHMAWLLEPASKMWSGWMSAAERDQFELGGFWATDLGPSLVHVGLNTVVFMQSNKAAPDADPLHQLEWLEGVLNKARAEGKRALVSAHVPLGVDERGRHTDAHALKPAMREALMSVLLNHTDVVAAFIAGHEHTDTPRLIQHGWGGPQLPELLSPSLTPWNSTRWPTPVGGNNPGARCYTYDRKTGDIIDYNQYYVDLDKVTQADDTLDWQLEYRASDVYGSPITAAALEKYWKRIQHDDTEFAAYLKRVQVSVRPEKQSSFSCDSICRANHLCAFRFVNEAAYDSCMESFTSQ